MNRGRRRGITGIAVTVSWLLLCCGSALAQKVLNPTTGLAVTADAMSFGVHQGSAAFDVSPPVSGSAFISSATVAADGSVSVPMASLTWPAVPLPDQSGSCGGGCTWSVTGILLHIIPVSDATGHINPFTGAADLTAQFYVHVDLTETVTYTGIGSTSQTPQDCHFGSSASPISLNLTTGTTAEPQPPGSFYGPIAGTPYNESTGTLQLVDDTLVLPASQGCAGSYAFLEGFVNGFLGLPTSPGNAKIAVTATLNPILRRGVIAALVPDTHAGAAPLTVHFDASSSQVPAGASSYAFDFNGDGTVDQTSAAPTGSFTYPAPGSYTARVTVTDRDGDSDTTTIPITVSAPPPPGHPTVTGSGKLTAEVHGQTVTVSDGQTLSCPSGGDACTATVTATTGVPDATHAIAARSAVAIGHARMTLAAGTSTQVRFRLTKRGTSLLRRRGTLRVTVALVVRAGAGAPVTFHRTGTLRWPRHH